MSLEATMIIVDNSESSRNGDYTSTRWQAQVDAVSIVHSVKMRAHPQSAVGLMSMGGKGPEVLSTFTTDFGSILAGLHRTKIHGTSHLSSSIQVAALALKHRSEKSQRQRIIVFSCSPIAEDEKTLVKLAKKMKKNNVSIDVVAFGDLESDQTKKLEAFVDNVTSGDNSYLAIIPPGPRLLSEELQTTPILAGESAAAGGAGGGGGDEAGFNFEDAAENDPELAFALRLSLEEEKNRQEKEKREREAAEGKTELGNIPEESQGESSNARDKKDDDKMDTA
ncbi:26S proteasome regulatory subunit rpn10 [Penicillium ucsense]|uniref:26S proteasome regulatory subunit rpn10 n=2 Tax=Penicillium TaxID=5073 RepID=A0A8J8WJG4_9EURO|nr:26S proteasome non-ATPase regulatory subunit [Penicillium diatomitis]KAF7716530.1 26S proteasome regulatory subunit rpn10 [Penicillium ucsense]KAF7736555.1 26S proteasome regulatory subunit rpn10 [Penicillium ucsense]KAJ5475318.1 26S proteasome non-ATPase regulatory subunit [Penicillium diatomitis]